MHIFIYILKNVHTHACKHAHTLTHTHVFYKYIFIYFFNNFFIKLCVQFTLFYYK